MKIIRSGVFETNSSSCHSLVMNYVSSEKELNKDVQNCIKDKNQIVVTLRLTAIMIVSQLTLLKRTELYLFRCTAGL